MTEKYGVCHMQTHLNLISKKHLNIVKRLNVSARHAAKLNLPLCGVRASSPHSFPKASRVSLNFHSIILK